VNHRSKAHLLPGLLAALLLAPSGLMAQEASPPLSLTLPEAVRSALEQSRDVRDARLELEVARSQVTEAWGNVYPSLTLNASYSRNLTAAKSFLPAIIFDPDADPDEQIAVQFGSDNQWNSTLQLEQPLFQAQAFIGVGAASRFRALQEEVLRASSQAVATRVRLAFYDLLLAQEQARLTGNSVERVRESLTEAEALARAGLASEYEVLRLRVEVANLEPVLRQALNAVERNRRVLAVELDLDPAAPLVVEGSLATLDLDDPSLNSPANEAIVQFVGAGVPEQLSQQEVEAWVASRSELRQLEITETLRLAELRAEQANWFPEISLFGTYQVAAQQNGDPVFFGRDETERFTARSVGINLSWTLFNGFGREARISQRRSQLRQAATRRELAKDVAESSFRSILDQLEEARLRVQGQKLAVEQAQRGYEIASAQFREGLGSRLELTDAEVALRQSEFNYAQAVYDALAARARLDEAVGIVPGVDLPVGAVLGSR
jgi:outer membrane protein